MLPSNSSGLEADLLIPGLSVRNHNHVSYVGRPSGRLLTDNIADRALGFPRLIPRFSLLNDSRSQSNEETTGAP
jgi:hypothetical protein